MHNCVLVGDHRLLVSDSWNHCVRELDLKSMQVTTIAGTGSVGFTGDGGPATSAQFNFLMCVATNPSQTILHLTDLKNYRVRDMNLASGVVTTVAGNGKKGVPQNGRPASEASLVDPRAAASDASGNLYVLERNGHALRVVRPDGTIETVAGDGKKGFRDGAALQAQFGSPKHLCCDPTGTVFIADDENRAIRKYDPTSGQVTTVLGRGVGDLRIQLLHPHGVRWYAGRLYVVDTGNHRILRIQLTN